MDPLYVFRDLADFMHAYVPGTDLTGQQLESIGSFNNVPYDAQPEWLAYHPLISVITKMYQVTNLQCTALATGAWPESGIDDLKPDACVYGTEAPARLAYDITEELAKKKPSNSAQAMALRSCSGRTAWAWMSTLIEVKTSANAAPFVVQEGGRCMLSKRTEAAESRAQMARYATEMQLRQHRTFVFTIFISRDLAWLMRWDRAGAVVSTPINYIHDPAPLLNFLYRLACLPRAAQGYDTSVSLASEQQVASFEKYLAALPADAKWLKRYGCHALSDKKFYPVHAVRCPDVEWMNSLDEKHRAFPGVSTRSHTYLIGRYHNGTRSPTGRGGKGFIAYDIDRRRLVFLKDYWCADASGVHPELEVYRILHEKRIGHVATAIAGGDVGGTKAQCTHTQDLISATRKPARRFHHRIIVWEVGRPLDSYERSGVLVGAVLQAIHAHKEAWETAGILHRDVSMGNILIDTESRAVRAFLNDWDLCKYKEELGEGAIASQHGRSGTWPYMSGILLKYPRKPNELADDIESFVYVITIALLRFHLHSLSVEDAHGIKTELAMYYTQKFDTYDEAKGGYIVGGTAKVRDMCLGDPGFTLAPKNSEKLSDLLTGLYQLGKNHYSKLDFEELQRKYGVERLPDPSSTPAVANEGEESDYDMEIDFGEPDPEIVLTPRKDSATVIDTSTPRSVAHTTIGATSSISNPSHLPPPAGPSLPGSAAIAESTPPTTGASVITGDFNSHDSIISVFTGLSKSIWIKDKVDDQFVGLPFYRAFQPKMSTGGSDRRKRGSHLDDASGRRRTRSKPSTSSSSTTPLEMIAEDEQGDVFGPVTST